jgi:hypothetical protein
MATPVFTYESMSRDELVRECRNKQALINRLNEVLLSAEAHAERMKRSAEAGELLGFANECRRLVAILRSV